MLRRALHLLIATVAAGGWLFVAESDDAVLAAPPSPGFPPVDIVGLAVGGGGLLEFVESAPQTGTGNTAVSGFESGDVLTNIDFRPATGEAFGLAVNATLDTVNNTDPDTLRLYVLDRSTGVATPVGSAPVLTETTLDSTHWSMDFDPSTDEVRVVNSAGENLRLDPTSGALVSRDTPLDLTGVSEVAYDRNVASDTGPPAATTAYAVRGGSLVTIGSIDGSHGGGLSPNSGVVMDVGPLGTSSFSGFDIAANGTALGTRVESQLGTETGTLLYRVDLHTGETLWIGWLGTPPHDDPSPPCSPLDPTCHPVYRGTPGTVITDIAVVDGSALPSGASSYVGVPSHRLVDTRQTAKVPAGGVLTVPVTGRGEVPATGVSAAILNVTVTQPDAPGFTTVWPSGTAMTTTSSVNVDSIDQTRAALVTVPVGADGAVNVFSERGSHVIVDVVGYFKPASDYLGRLFTLTPSRLLDTRSGLGQPEGIPAKPAPGSTVDLAVVDRGGVPASGVRAVVLSVTMTQTTAPGFVTVHAGDTELPLASNLNASTTDETIANLVIVPVGADGTVKLFTEAGTHLLADVVGYFAPAQSAADVTDGLFMPITPERILDTRIGLGAPAGIVGPGASVDVQVGGAGGVPPTGVMALSGTATATASLTSGFVTVYPTSTELPVTSNLNTNRTDQTIATGIVLGLGTQGRITLFTETGTHLLIDATGYYLD